MDAPTEKKRCIQNGKKGAPPKKTEKGAANTLAKDEYGIVEKENELSDREKQFCVFFVKSHNATKAYMKAYGCDYAAAAVSASRKLKNVKIQEFIKSLKNERANQEYFCVEDLVQKYIDIAFADIRDIVTLEDTGIQLKEDADTSVVKRIKMTKSGVDVQMQDQMKALEWLDRYFEVNPEAKRRREYEMRRIELMQGEAQEGEQYGVIEMPPVREDEDETDAEESAGDMDADAKAT